MKKLLIVRHAKALKAKEGTDFNRLLSPSGERDTLFMANKIISRGLRIQYIQSSDAQRTVRTTALLNQTLGLSPTHISYSSTLYGATANALIQIIKCFDDNIDQVMIVGHNPGVTDAINELAQQYFTDIPTCGMVCILFPDTSWQTITQNKMGSLGFYIYPKMFNSLHSS